MAIQQSVAELREDIMLAKSTLKEAQARGEAKKSYHYLVKQIGCLERNLAGSATKTALLASYVSYIFRDQPYEGLVETVNVLGSDTDTIATMAGAILGVMANDDPPQAVMDMEYLKKEAERLYQLSEGYETKSFVYPDMLYWQPPATQIDSLGEHEGKLVLQGLGGAEPVSQSTFEQGKDSNWEWMKLEFGQTVLVRRRSKAVTVTKDSLPVNPAHIATEKKFYSKRYSTPVAHPGRQMSNQGQLLRAQMPLVTPQREEITIDRATDEVIRSGFREDVIGSMLIKLAVQENGIEKAIAFASIVAKSKLARMKKHSDYK